jgi:hypothetical protein
MLGRYQFSLPPAVIAGKMRPLEGDSVAVTKKPQGL